MEKPKLPLSAAINSQLQEPIIDHRGETRIDLLQLLAPHSRAIADSSHNV